MGRVGVGSREELVKAMLWMVNREGRDVQSRAAEAGGTDRDQQRSRGFPTCFQIVKPFANQVSARVCLEIHDPRNYTAEQGERAPWWRRRESNPRPKQIGMGHLRA